MNEEEKKAIEDMNRFANGIDMSCVTARQMQIILNLVEKLQKENKELRESNKKLYEIGQEMCKQDKYTRENYISVQKVKNKIKKLNDVSNAEELEDIMIGKNYTITELVQYVLQELIEGRSRE